MKKNDVKTIPIPISIVTLARAGDLSQTPKTRAPSKTLKTHLFSNFHLHHPADEEMSK